MSNIEINQELRAEEEGMINRFSLIVKVMLLLAIICAVFYVVIFMGTYIWNYGYNWAGLSFSSWTLILSLMILFFILIDIVLYCKVDIFDKRRIKTEKPKPKFIQGKRIHQLTFPKGAEGGIFSKTYIKIDEHNVLRLRLLMVKPKEMWNKFKEEKEVE